MATFTPKKLNSTEINSGAKYKNGDGIVADDLNKIVEGVLYSQENGGGGTGSSITVDDELSPTSTNPLQNRVITAYIKKFVEIENSDREALEHLGMYYFVEYYDPNGGDDKAYRGTVNLENKVYSLTSYSFGNTNVVNPSDKVIEIYGMQGGQEKELLLSVTEEEYAGSDYTLTIDNTSGKFTHLYLIFRAEETEYNSYPMVKLKELSSNDFVEVSDALLGG